MASVPARPWRRVAAGVAIALAALGAASPPALASEVEPQPPSPSSPVTTVLDNPFLPDDPNVNLTDCISALPRPGCGSEERGDWRQSALFGVVAAALAAIGVRIAVGVRRRGREQAHPG